MTTKLRYYGTDVPFCDWMRNRSGIDAQRDAVVLTDTDVVLHQFATGVIDASDDREVKTRNIQALMGVEVKTRNGEPDFSQIQTLWKWHRTRLKYLDLREDKFTPEDWIIRNFGWSIVKLSNTAPDNSDQIAWGRFDKYGVIQWREIDLQMLIALLSFNRHPDNFVERIFKSHHRTSTVWGYEKQPLGFTIPIVELKRY